MLPQWTSLTISASAVFVSVDPYEHVLAVVVPGAIVAGSTAAAAGSTVVVVAAAVVVAYAEPAVGRRELGLAAAAAERVVELAAIGAVAVAEPAAAAVVAEASRLVGRPASTSR